MKNIIPFVLVLLFLSGCAGGNSSTPSSTPSEPTDNRTTEQMIEDGDLIRQGDDLVPSEAFQKKLDAAMAKQEAAEAKKINDDYNLVLELEAGDDAKKAGKAKGSCEAIDHASTCVEYYGSFWTPEQIRFNCEGAGTYSDGPCPSDMVGGCNTGFGTQADMVAWIYSRGGGEMTAESFKYAKMACDATMASKWIQMK